MARQYVLIHDSTEGIVAQRKVAWRAGPVNGVTMGFKKFLINKQPLDDVYIRGIPLNIVYVHLASTCNHKGVTFINHGKN